MTKFYGEKSLFSTEEYTDLANYYLKHGTLPTTTPWICAPNCHGSNTWQNSDQINDDVLKDWQQLNEVKLVTDGEGNTKIQLVSQPANNEIAIIDWLTVTFRVDTFIGDYSGKPEELHRSICIEKMSDVLDHCFGFKVGAKRKSGRQFYEECHEIINHQGVGVGDLCIGGQNETMMLSISGQGCCMGDYGWQYRFYNFVKSANRAKITRCDLAHDDFDGDYLSIHDLNERETNKEFYYFGKPARVTWHGDWKYNDRDNLGLTLQIGERSSDKMMRAYEKGKQLGDKNSAWVRLEVELKAKHTHIPFDVIINPSDYFINLYPCFKTLFQYDDQKQSRIEYVQRTTKIKLKKGIEILRHQFGSWLGFFRQYFESDEQCLDALAGEFQIPKRFELIKQDWDRIQLQIT